MGKGYINKFEESLRKIPTKIKEHPKTTATLAVATGLTALGIKLYNDYCTKQISPEELDSVVNWLYERSFKLTEHRFYKPGTEEVVQSFKVFDEIPSDDNILDVLDIMDRCTNGEEYSNLLKKAFPKPNNYIEDNGIYKYPPENIEYVKETLGAHLKKPIYKTGAIISGIAAGVLTALSPIVYRKEKRQLLNNK